MTDVPSACQQEEAASTPANSSPNEECGGSDPTGAVTTQLATPEEATAIRPKLSHAGLLMASQVVKWSLRFVFVLSVARVLGPKELGVYALLFTVVEFLAVASGAGYTDYLTREAAKNARVGWGLASQLVILRIAIAIPVAVIAIGILSLAGYPHRVLTGMAWMALTIVPRSFSEAVQGVLRGIHQYTSHLVIEIASGGSLVAGSVALVAMHGGLGTAITIEILAAAAGWLAGLAFALRFSTRERIRLTRPELLKKSAVFNAYSLIGTLYDRFDVVLLSRLAGDYVTGIYTVAYRAVSMMQIVGYGVFYSLLPTLSRDAVAQVELRRLEKALGLLLSAGFLIVLATTIFARPAVAVILGPQYAESEKALKILVWAVILRYLNYALNIGLLAAGRERVFVRTTLTCLAVNLVGNLALIPRFGWPAAAVVTIVTELVLLAQNCYWTRRTVGRIAPPLEAARTSLAFVVVLAVAVVGGRLGSPLLVGTGCLVVFAAYLMRTGILNEFTAIWGRQRSMVS